MNIGVLLMVILIVLVLLGMPVSLSIGIASMACISYGGYQMVILPQKMFSGVDSFVLLAIPYFVLAGNIMGKGGITQKVLDFASAAFGWLKGSLAIITVAASAIFAALTGSGVATASAIGGLMIPSMEKEGYDKHFAAAIVSNAAILGPLIPPSIFLINYGNAAELDVSSLFKAAIVPGVFMAVTMAAYCVWYAHRHNLKAGEKFSARKTLKATKDGIWALLMPILLLGVIFGGVCTPTEAASVACAYTFLVALLIYRTIRLKDALEILEESALAAAVMMFLMGCSHISGWVLAISKVPSMIAEQILSWSSSPILIMILINLFLIVVGMFMEANAAIVILTPILLPVATACGLSPVQFGIVLCVNLCMGLVTPPVGGCIIIGNDIAHGKLERTFICAVPLLIVEAITLTLVNAVPAFSMWLPSVLSK